MVLRRVSGYQGMRIAISVNSREFIFIGSIFQNVDRVANWMKKIMRMIYTKDDRKIKTERII